MMDQLVIFLTDFLEKIRIADLFDIAIIGVLIYSVILWFKETASRSILIGFLLLMGLYAVSRVFDLYMTVMLFHAFFAVLLVMLVVVFQEDIRRFFERIAILGTFTDRRKARPNYPSIDVLVESVTDLATRKVGALVVLKGEEPLERHYNGGIPLYGRVSKPLLDSIFDPYSAGHDGAVIIEGERISKFGAHLPLSQNLAAISHRGTRHSAALGISECTDALAVVVSEEKGTFGIAEGGRFQVLDSAAALKSRLERFYVERFPKDTSTFWERVLKKNTGTKIVALLLATAMWFLLAYETEVVRRVFTAPIEYRNLSQEWLIEEPKPANAQVTLSGPTRVFDLMDPNELIISLDLTSIREGIQEITIDESEVKTPTNLTIQSIDPHVIFLEAHKIRQVELPVEVMLKGKLKKNLSIGRIIVTPPKLKVTGRIAALEGVTSVKTHPVNLNDISGTVSFQGQLIIPEHIRAEQGLSKVDITIEILTPEDEAKTKTTPAS